MKSKSFEVTYLDPGRIHFERRGDTLSLALADGTWYPRVVLRLCFPVSEERGFVSVRDARGEEQEEIGIIEDWTKLAEEDRQAVAAELGLHYFVPEVKRVINIKEEFGFLYWTVETDRGAKEFVMRNRITRYAREVGPGRWLLIDVNKTRYEIPDIEALDPHSQKLVRRSLCL